MQLAAARGAARRLAMAPHFLDDRHHGLKFLFGPRIHETVMQVRPLGAHQVIALPREPRPQLLCHKRHEGVQKSKQVVQTEICDVLCDRVTIAQPVLHGFQVPVAKLVPSKAVRGVDRILKREALDAGRDVPGGGA